ncbi:MAG: hypothetical protein NZ811_07165 [Gammaproteobacteria bacterium]|nr:hypothetical protein [Gammaproteobacteria bacterium]
MPREQRTNLKKTAVNKTDLGIYESKPSGAVDMPSLTPVKSKGQALAEGLSMFAKGAQVVGQSQIDENAKRNAITQRYTGISAGKLEATRILQDLEDRKEPLAKYGEQLSIALGGANDRLGKEGSVPAPYLEGYMSTLGSMLGAKQDGVQASLDADRLAEQHKKVRQGMKQDIFVNGKSGVEALKDVQAALNLGNDDSAKFYLSNMIALIDQRADEDVNFDGQGAVNMFLKLTPEKGIVFADHPVYGDMIEKAEAKLLAGKGSALKAQVAFAKKITKDVTSKAMALVLKLGAGPQELLEAEGMVEAASKYMSGKERGTFVKLLRDLRQTGYATTTDPTAFFKAKEQASKGEIGFNEILKLNTKLTAADVKEVYNVKISRDSALATKEGSRFYANMDKLASSAKSVLNVMSGPDKFLDPVKGANRVQHFGDAFMLDVENYKAENNVQVVPYKELLKMRDEAQKNAQDAFPMTTPADVGGATLDTGVKPGEGTASNPRGGKKKTSLVDDLFDLFSDD